MTDTNQHDEGGIGVMPVPRRRRRGLVVALVALVVSAALIGVAARQLVSDADDEVVLSVTQATLDPEELADIVGPTTTIPVEATVSPAPLSPLAAGLPELISAIPQPPSTLPIPVSLRIDSINVEGDPMVTVGVDDKGEFAVPDVEQIGWYGLGQRPGEPGATVMAAHVSWKKKAGVFSRLGNVEPGDEIFVGLSDGSEQRYIAWERTMYDKTGLPADRIWTRTGNEVLVLITCGGEFNPEIRRYRQNIVVYALPVD